MPRSSLLLRPLRNDSRTRPLRGRERRGDLGAVSPRTRRPCATRSERTPRGLLLPCRIGSRAPTPCAFIVTCCPGDTGPKTTSLGIAALGGGPAKSAACADATTAASRSPARAVGASSSEARSRSRRGRCPPFHAKGSCSQSLAARDQAMRLRQRGRARSRSRRLRLRSRPEGRWANDVRLRAACLSPSRS